MSRRPPVAVARAGRLVGTPAARELVPTVPGQSARWHIHDYPGPYCRWNYHPQYEIHLIQHSSGRFIVGDCIDTFAAGQLTLIGSNLPHHWISDTVPGEHVSDRDVVFQFHPTWVAGCRRLVPEFAALDPLLRRAARGLAFDPDTAHAATPHLIAIGDRTGLERLAAIVGLLTATRAGSSRTDPHAGSSSGATSRRRPPTAGKRARRRRSADVREPRPVPPRGNRPRPALPPQTGPRGDCGVTRSGCPRTAVSSGAPGASLEREVDARGVRKFLLYTRYVG
jgi:hypothetical protein